MKFIFFFFYSSAFLWGLLPCVWTNDLAFVCHTSERAGAVRDLRPIYSDLEDPFATVKWRLLSVRCHRILIPVLFSNVEHYILGERIFFRFTLENSDPSSGVEPGSSHFVVRCFSNVLAGPGDMWKYCVVFF